MHRVWCCVAVVLTGAILASPTPSDRFHDSEQVNSIGESTTCHVKEFTFTATVTDSNGKMCSGKVTTKACFGSCESSESGTFRFPWMVRVQPVCNYGQVLTRIVRLRHCEPGADRDAAFYRFPEAKTCVCEICDPKRQHCEPHTTPSPFFPELGSTIEPLRLPNKESTVSFSDYSNDAPAPGPLLLPRLLRRKWH